MVKVGTRGAIAARHLPPRTWPEISLIAKVLQRPTLVLNRNWQPVNVATVARALSMLWSETVRVVDPADYQLYDWQDWSRLVPANGQPFIQAVSQRIRAPEVVALTQFDRVPSSAVTFSRRNIFRRDRFACQYCGRQPVADALTIDHVVPRAQGGQSNWENCVLACLPCNHKKADRTPQQASMKLKKVPARPQWNPLYSQHSIRFESWSKFISDAYWNAELDNG